MKIDTLFQRRISLAGQEIDATSTLSQELLESKELVLTSLEENFFEKIDPIMTIGDGSEDSVRHYYPIQSPLKRPINQQNHIEKLEITP